MYLKNDMYFILLKDPPTWSGKEQNNKSITSYPGEMTVLNCTVSANPEPTFSWLFNGSTVRDKVTSISNLLIINPTAITDFGTYTCIATNVIYGESKSSNFYINLVLYGPPQSTSLQLEHRTSVSIHLTWTAGFNGGSDQFYTMEYKVFNEENYIVSINKITAQEGDHLNYTLTGLHNNTLYNIRLLAINHNTVGLKQSVSYLNATTLGLFETNIFACAASGLIMRYLM